MRQRDLKSEKDSTQAFLALKKPHTKQMISEAKNAKHDLGQLSGMK